MPEIKYKLDEHGEPVCDAWQSGKFKCEAKYCVHYHNIGIPGNVCPPGLKQQRDEARRERDELQVFVCDETVLWQDERNSNTKDTPEIAEEYGWNHLVVFQRNSTGELKKVFRSDIKTDCLYDKWRKINGICS